MSKPAFAAPCVALVAVPAADDDKPVWVQVARCGRFEGYGAGPFEFTPPGMATLVDNFHKHPSFHLGPKGVGDADVVAWDFHHASEMPAAQVGTVGAPAQGWILDLKTMRGADGVVQLWALTRWLPLARDYIRNGQYRWASVSVVLDAIDPVSGRSIGPVLTSVALTNQPFIEGMQPLAASKQSASANSKDNNMTDLQKRIIARARVLRAETPTVALALSRATAELMPTASNNERHGVWGPLLAQHNLETVRHAVSHGATLAKAPSEQRAAAPSASSDTRPTLDVSLQHGPNTFAKLLAHVKGTNPRVSHDDATAQAMALNRSHRIVA